MKRDVGIMSRRRAAQALDNLNGDPVAFTLLLEQFEMVIGPGGFAAAARYDHECKAELHPGAVEVMAFPYAWWDGAEKDPQVQEE